MRTTQWHEVKKAAVTKLAEELEDIPVFYGHPGDRFEVECVWLGDGSSSQEWAQLGAQAKNEVAVIDLHVWAGLPGDDQEEATGRAFAIRERIEEVARRRDFITLNGTSWNTNLSSFEIREGYTEEGRVTALIGQLEASLRI